MYEPIYRAAEDLDLAISVHLGHASNLYRMLRPVGAPNSMYVTAPLMIAAEAVVKMKMAQKYPSLRWGFIEGSASWVPFLAYRAVTEFGKMPTWRERADTIIPDNNIYISCEAFEDFDSIMRVIHMLPPKYFAAQGKTEFIAAPHGTGPFMADALNDARSQFVANPHAWRPPQISKLTWLQVPDGISRVQAILSEAADIAFNVGPGAEGVVRESGAWVDAVSAAGVDTMPFITVKDSPVQDKRVRLAVNYAVNKTRIAATLLEGRTHPANQFAPPGVFGYDPSLAPPFPHDPERARALLVEAGYPDGIDLVIELYLDSAEKAAIVQQVASDLAEAGIRLTIANSTVMDIQERGLFGGRWTGDMMRLPYYGLPSFDALAPFNVHSCLWLAPFHCDPEITERVLDARRTFGLKERLTKTRALHQLLLANPSALLLFDSVRYFVVAERVTGYRAPFGIIRFHELGLAS